MGESDSITVSITRTVKPGHEEAFERALHDFVQRSLPLPGQMGVHVMRPAPGSDSRDYGIVRRFANRAALRSFHESPEYLTWSESVIFHTEGDARTEELCGLESWVTMPGAPLKALPRWKVSVATLLGVYPTSLALGATVGSWTRSWHFLLGSLLFSAVMVALLTWVVMPVVTRLLHSWLHAGKSD